MPLDLSAPRVHYFQCRGRNRDRRNYSLRSSRRPVCPQRVHAPISRLFGAGCWQCASRVVGKAEQITKGRRPKLVPWPRGNRLPEKFEWEGWKREMKHWSILLLCGLLASVPISGFEALAQDYAGPLLPHVGAQITAAFAKTIWPRCGSLTQLQRR